jgi:hypothetical protein
MKPTRRRSRFRRIIFLTTRHVDGKLEMGRPRDDKRCFSTVFVSSVCFSAAASSGCKSPQKKFKKKLAQRPSSRHNSPPCGDDSTCHWQLYRFLPFPAQALTRSLLPRQR